MARRRKKGRFTKARTVARRTGGRVRRAAGRFRARMRGRSLGLVGKTGVGIAAGAPLLASGFDAGSSAIEQMRANNAGLVSTAEYGFWRFLNGLSQGFGMGNIRDRLFIHKTDGSAVEVAVGSGIPSGSWFKTSVIGGTLVAWDVVVSWTTRKFAKVSSGVRFMGTKLTGGK